jgi:NAD+ synthase (glutamine-hydrolysing)
VAAVAKKSLLPAYDVFDEVRHFEPAKGPTLVRLAGRKAGLTICEDLWNDKDFFRKRRLYPNDPGEILLSRGADLIVNVSASPFSEGKPRLRRRMLSRLARDGGVPVAYLNLVGGNDELVFDGGSMVLDGTGRVRARAALFAEDFVVVDLDGPRVTPVAGSEPADLPDDVEGEPLESLRRALVLGIRDYARKCGFGTAVVGLSGGIDSALVGALAVDALGAANVTGLALPSRYSSEGSIADARSLADALGIRLEVLPIEPIFAAAKATLTPLFAGRPEDVTEENLQARIRGMLLMAFSNKLGPLLLTTGNKSELAVGYCTLYGDMCGGLAPISDLPKMRVYALARHLNRRAGREVIPVSTLEKPPSAELRPGQTDQDSLPPYELLDRILEGLVERGRPPPPWSGTRARRWRSSRGSRGRSTGPSTSGSRPPPGSGCRRRLSGAGAASRSRRFPAREVRRRPAALALPVEGDSRLLARHPPSRIAARGEGLSVLDVGFGAGHLARRIRPLCRYLAGIELDPQAALEGAAFFDDPARGGHRPRPVRAVAGAVRRRRRGGHPRAPSRAGRALALLGPLLKPDGLLLVSLPNVANVTVRLGLLFGRFPSADRGILDRTHLRFFTRRSGRELLQQNGFRVVRETPTAMPVELAFPFLGRPPLAPAVRGLARLLSAFWPGMFGYQFVYEARPA